MSLNIFIMYLLSVSCFNHFFKALIISKILCLIMINIFSIKYTLSVRKYQSLFDHILFIEVFIKAMKYLLNIRKKLIIYNLLKSLSDQITDFIYIKEFNKSSL